MRTLFLASTVALLLAGQLQAHFLFIRIVAPKAERRVAEVFFSDRADAGDPQFIAKIADTRLWVQQTPGRFEALKVAKREDRLTASLPAAGAVMVVGECVYGVLPRKTPFLLRHFPKSIAGAPEDVNRLQPFRKLPLEILAQAEKNGLRLTVAHRGKPLPNAPINTLADDLSGEQLKADGNGNFFFQPPRAGHYTIYTSHFSKESGKLGQERFEEIRDFATLSFTWPLQR